MNIPERRSPEKLINLLVEFGGCLMRPQDSACDLLYSVLTVYRITKSKTSTILQQLLHNLLILQQKNRLTGCDALRNKRGEKRSE
jgi:hypothetical protein